MSRKAWIWLVVAAVVVGGVAYGVSVLRGGVAPPQFVTATAGPGDVVLTVTGNGSLEAIERSTVMARVGGEVAALPVSEGDSVTVGENLLELGSADLEYQVRGAQMDLESARLSLRDLLDLGPTDPIPSEVSESVHRVVAPDAGRVLRIHPREGDRVSRDAPVAELVDDQVARFEFTLAPDLAEKVTSGDSGEVYLDGFDGLVSARVVDVSPGDSGDQPQAMSRVTLGIANPAGLIEPGTGGYATVFMDGRPLVRPGEVVEAPITRVFPGLPGVVESVAVQQGDSLARGDQLLMIATGSHSLQVRQQLIRIAQVEMTLERYRREIADLVHASPMEGRIVEIFPDIGDRVNVGAPLVEIARMDEFLILIDVDELEVSSIEIGADVAIELDALPGLSATGTILSIAESGSVGDGITTYPVKIRLDAYPGMREGMSADVTIEIERRVGTLSVPAEAVTTSRGISSVRVVTEDSVQSREVEIGLTDGVRTEILGGLDPGDEVVIAAVDRDTMPFMGPGRN